MDRQQALMQTIAQQRNQALDAAANLHADLIVAHAKIKELEAEVARLSESSNTATP